MHLSLLSLMISVAVLVASAAVSCYCWQIARRRRRDYGRHDGEWARLTAALRDVDRKLDWVAATAARDGRYR